MNCPRCSAVLPDDEGRCLSCGHPLDRPAITATSATPPQVSVRRQVIITALRQLQEIKTTLQNELRRTQA